MADAAIEKRATRRFCVRLPISLQGISRTASDLRTRDVSARGVSFYCERPLAEGSDIEFTLTLPPEVTQTESISMRCFGRVVRVENATDRTSVAAVIERYELLGNS